MRDIQRRQHGRQHILVGNPWRGRPGRSGHCVGGDSLIYTPSGPKRVDKLAKGDLVYSFDDYTLAERECIGVNCHGQRPVVRVTLEDGRSLLSTTDQMMVKVCDPRSDLKWAMRWFVWERLSEFQAGHMVVAAKASPETIVQKPLIEEEEFARFIGYRDASLAEYAVNPFYDETYTELLNVRAMEPGGEALVYEVAVQFDESFVANGFVLL